MKLQNLYSKFSKSQRRLWYAIFASWHILEDVSLKGVGKRRRPFKIVASELPCIGLYKHLPYLGLCHLVRPDTISLPQSSLLSDLWCSIAHPQANQRANQEISIYRKTATENAEILNP